MNEIESGRCPALPTEHALSVSRRRCLPRSAVRRLVAKPNTTALRAVRSYDRLERWRLEVSDSIHPADRFSLSMTIAMPG